MISVFTRLEKTSPVKFFYREEWLAGFAFTADDSGKALGSVLIEKFKGTGITVNFLFGYAVVITQDPAQFLDYKHNLERIIASRKTIQSRTIGEKSNAIPPGRNKTLHGIVRSSQYEKPLEGIEVLINDRTMATTDEKGRYTISLNGTDFVLSFRAPGFEEQIVDLQIYESGEMNILLEDSPTILDEVVLTDVNLSSREMGQSTLKLQEIKRAPALLGEADLIRQIQLQPGVTTVGEISNGFNVRGGGVDQNLVLYDGVPVFNTAHALGFFSAFNTNAIQQASFYRGGIPVEFGGRASSVLDITSKEGPERWHGTGGIGILSSHASIGGPIKKDTTTITASMRASYSDWVLNSIKSNYADLRNSSLSFYDGSIKLAHKFTARTKLTLSGYFSKDQFTLSTDTSYRYQNATASLSLDHSLTDKLFVRARLGFGRYQYNVSEPQAKRAFDLEYGITYPSLSLDFGRDGKHKLSFGLQSTYYEFSPGSLRPGSKKSTLEPARMAMEPSLEHAVYFGDEFSPLEKLTVRGGIRMSYYQRLGKGIVYVYDPGLPKERKNIIDSIQYGRGEPMKSYVGLEPRISASYSLHKDGTLKLGYNRMYQYLHLITNTASVTPIDIWQSANTHFKPQIADQVSLGYYREFKSNTIEAFAEVFYKNIQNVLDFKDGAKLILNPALETALLPGRAISYGIETSLEKKSGRLLGTVSYTYSRSFRIVDGNFDNEKINNGRQYRSNYDQPHALNFSWRYNISRRHFFTGNFTWRTGRPISLPTSAYSVDGVPILEYSDRNTYRLPDYHRLDLALVIEGSHKRKKILDGTWTISFFNVYNRKNAYSVFYKDDGEGNIKPYKLSVIGSIIPSIHYNFKF